MFSGSSFTQVARSFSRTSVLYFYLSLFIIAAVKHFSWPAFMYNINSLLSLCVHVCRNVHVHMCVIREVKTGKPWPLCTSDPSKSM